MVCVCEFFGSESGGIVWLGGHASQLWRQPSGLRSALFSIDFICVLLSHGGIGWEGGSIQQPRA
jgi:hypothetical protein